MAGLRRVVILGPGAAGKSALAARLGEITGLPVSATGTSGWRMDAARPPCAPGRGLFRRAGKAAESMA
jgi:adenylate kinase family enzyme